MQSTRQSVRASLSLSIALGFLGAVALVFSHTFFTPGKGILLPYAVFVVAIAVVLRSTEVVTYKERFLVAFGAFVIASGALYIAVFSAARTLAMISAAGHAWRLAVIVAAGALLSLCIARVSGREGWPAAVDRPVA